MDGILDDFKQVFRSNNRLAQLIIVNAALFILFNIINAASTGDDWLTWVGTSTTPSEWITRPWTLLTYSVTHIRFGHVLWNLLTLYWFGRIFSLFMPGDKILWLYIAGGIYAGLFFAISTLVPGLYPMSIALIGASGSIMAIVVATAMLSPDYQLNLILIGPVKLKFVALGIFVMSTLIDFNQNLGGKMAHLGGAVFGYLYITSLRKGLDLTSPFRKAWDFLVAVTKRNQNKMKVVYKSDQRKSRTTSKNKDVDQSKIDSILDKINASGYDSLSKEEKDILFNAGRKN